MSAPKSISILGSTGSVGANTVELVELHNKLRPGTYAVEALTANNNVALLIEQARRLKPKFVAISNIDHLGVLKSELSGSGVSVAAGKAAVIDAAQLPADWVMASIVGAAGLEPTLAAVARGKTVAIANKECLVSAGDLFMSQVKKAGTLLLPVDSEHNAVFQVFDPTHLQAIEKIVLTASGGPFRTWSREMMQNVSPAQACKHPNYEMGAKISVDSATLMNKGLELIEAHHIFGVAAEKLGVVVHPQQAVHCLVTYADGSVLAQMASPDMRTPIAHALGYPDRIAAPTKPLDLTEMAQLTFERPDLNRFPCLALAQDALRHGEGAPTVLNAANEVAVQSFLAGILPFGSIADVVSRTLDACVSHTRTPYSIEDALALDSLAREHAKRALKNVSGGLKG